MKIITAMVTVRLDDGETDIEAVAAVDEALMELEFDEPIDVTSLVDRKEADILHIMFKQSTK